MQVEWLLLVYWKDDIKETEAGKAPFNRHRSCDCSLMNNLSNIITEINKLNTLTRRIHWKTSTENINKWEFQIFLATLEISMTNSRSLQFGIRN